jgi:predicted permease
MPPMITAAALLSLAGLAPELAAALVGFGIVLSMATLPAWHAVLATLG